MPDGADGAANWVIIVCGGSMMTMKHDVWLALPAPFVAVTVRQWFPGCSVGIRSGELQGAIAGCESQMQRTCGAAPPPRVKLAFSGGDTVLPLIGLVITTVGGSKTLKQFVCVAVPAALVAVTVKQ
jgi:hypothetical protein